MARAWRPGAARRLVNGIVRALLPLGLGPPRTWLLTVAGRRTGIERSTPVTLVERAGERWLVAPYGEVEWVRNVRAAGRGWLSRGARVERVRFEEVPAPARAPILQAYARQVPVTRPYFDARHDGPEEDFAAEAERHPVFVIRPVDRGRAGAG